VQRPDPDKRRLILAVAAKLFASRPYHEVKLDDVAAAAKIGKGTLYVYFAGKEQLYAALLDEGFATMIDELQKRLQQSRGPALADLREIVRSKLAHARRVPHLFQLLREGQQLPCAGQLVKHRDALTAMVADVLRRGIERGELRDAHPELTALYVPSLVRAAVLFGPRDFDPDMVADHIVSVLTSGLATRRGARTVVADGPTQRTKGRAPARAGQKRSQR
jgi:AcrR family transcriptional regulator